MAAVCPEASKRPLLAVEKSDQDGHWSYLKCKTKGFKNFPNLTNISAISCMLIVENIFPQFERFKGRFIQLDHAEDRKHRQKGEKTRI